MHAENKVFERKLLETVLQRFTEEPVVLIEGPRSVGKSTLLKGLAEKTGGTIVDLDRPGLRSQVADDPEYFVSGDGPVLVDEYQHVPEILDAIKARLNVSGVAGQFVLTGSSRHESLPRAAQALTGRLHRMPLYPLSQGEICDRPGNLLEALATDFTGLEESTPSKTTRSEYVEMIVTGGLPPAVHRSTATSRGRWMDDYIALVLERDVEELSRVRQAEALPRLLRRLASQTGQVLNLSNAAHACGLESSTAGGYLRLLESVFLVHRLPAWGRNLRSRISRKPKIHILDSGLAARLMRVTGEKLGRKDEAALSDFGHLLETFVVGELMKQASLMDEVTEFGHWRTHDGDEVDLVVELADGRILAFEIKASGRVTDSGLKPLRKLRGTVGDAFAGGVVFHLGAHPTQTKDGIRLMPVDKLWT